MEVLNGQRPEAIEWAFKQYFRTPPSPGNSKWFPEEWQIIELLKAWERNRLQAQKEAEERVEREETERRRANGQLIGWAQVKEIFKETLAKIEARQFPDLPSGRKEQLQQQIVSLHRKSRERKSTQQAGPGGIRSEISSQD